MLERRSHIRLKTPVLIEYPNPTTWKTERSFTQDVSETGIRFPTPIKLQIGQELALTLELPFQDSTFHAMGEIIWIREIACLGATQYEVGLRFRWIEDPDQQRLTRVLNNFLAPRV